MSRAKKVTQAALVALLSACPFMSTSMVMTPAMSLTGTGTGKWKRP
ncbi:hypothetical protein [Pseudohongiella nitratireducens]|nr:hypothetical protein [Pseudohongiella nitratireducens]MDF1623414.1 hypothetical protein [Pseudohongiella nitratireducens]